MSTRFHGGISPIKTSLNRIKLSFLKADSRLVDAWNYYIMPEIRNDHCRADRGWNWKSILLRTSLACKALGQSLEAISVTVFNQRTYNHFPVGMMIIVNKALSPFGNGHCIYIWYISTAPKSAINHHLPNFLKPKGIGVGLIDFALSISINCQYLGQTLLHAAPPFKGCPDNLLRWYAKIGMQKLPPTPKKIVLSPLLSRKNDGRYFYTDKKSALAMSQALDVYR